jgi:hypothetical protein
MSTGWKCWMSVGGGWTNSSYCLSLRLYFQLKLNFPSQFSTQIKFMFDFCLSWTQLCFKIWFPTSIFCLPCSNSSSNLPLLSSTPLNFPIFLQLSAKLVFPSTNCFFLVSLLFHYSSRRWRVADVKIFNLSLVVLCWRWRTADKMPDELSYRKKRKSWKRQHGEIPSRKLNLNTQKGERQDELFVRCHLEDLIKFKLRLPRVFQKFSIENPLNKVWGDQSSLMESSWWTFEWVFLT